VDLACNLPAFRQLKRMGTNTWWSPQWLRCLSAFICQVTSITLTDGADKVVFGTDFCVVSQKEDVAVVARLPISTREKE
jgi:hypothetical protein